MNFRIGRSLQQCFGMRRLEVGRVELQHRVQARVSRLVGRDLFDRGRCGRRFHELVGQREFELVDQCELGRRFARYRRLFVVRDRLIRCRRARLRRCGFGRCSFNRRRELRFRELVDQCELGRCLAGYRRLFVVRDRLIRCRRDQRNEADIRAMTYALQHHVVAPDRRLDAALDQRATARIVKAGLGEISKTKQRSRRIAGADQRAVAGECGDRGIDASDQTLQPLRQRHGAAHAFSGRHQDAVAAIGKIKPCAGAGNEHTERRAEPAQPFQPDRAVQWQRPCELRHLAPIRIRRAEQLFGQCGAIGCAEQSGADRIGPQHPRAVDRPQPCRESARCMYRQPWIADASQLKFRVIHRSDMTG